MNKPRHEKVVTAVYRCVLKMPPRTKFHARRVFDCVTKELGAPPPFVPFMRELHASAQSEGWGYFVRE